MSKKYEWKKTDMLMGRLYWIKLLEYSELKEVEESLPFLRTNHPHLSHDLSLLVDKAPRKIERSFTLGDILDENNEKICYKKEYDNRDYEGLIDSQLGIGIPGEAIGSIAEAHFLNGEFKFGKSVKDLKIRTVQEFKKNLNLYFEEIQEMYAPHLGNQSVENLSGYLPKIIIKSNLPRKVVRKFKGLLE